MKKLTLFQFIITIFLVVFLIEFFLFSQNGRYITFGSYNSMLLDTRTGNVYEYDNLKNGVWKISIKK